LADKEYSEDVKLALKTLFEHCDQDDKAVRDRQIRLWKKLEFYWSGIQRIWWDEVAHDWRVYDLNNDFGGNGESSYYDKPINVYRAYLESIIAALSASTPRVRCYPDDADNVNDCLTARGGNKIAQLVMNRIDGDLKWIKALYVLCNQGMIAAYNYNVKDEKYGTFEVPEYKDAEEEVDNYFCPSCGTKLEGENLVVAEQMRITDEDEFRPDDEAAVQDYQQEGILCPLCQLMINPDLRTEKIIVRKMTGNTHEPKSSQELEVLGGLFVKVPNWARKQEDCPYLDYSYEVHYSNILAKYKHLREELRVKDSQLASSSGDDGYGPWGRLSPQYLGDTPTNNPTCHNIWFRPSWYEILDDDDRELLLKEFPEGVKVVFVNDQFAEACPEKMDDYWTLTFNPLSDSVHFDPLGTLVVSVQDISNDLIALILQTIEHGIPQTFADPKVLNFEQYRNSEIAPGSIFPAKAQAGKTVGEGFFTIATATLSQEVGPFAERINELGQFASGALPSIWGGEMSASSRTAAQYSMSGKQALQRLQTSWKILNHWWKNVFSKIIPAYIKNMQTDERIVQEQGDSFVNIVIKKAEMEGKIGSVHLDSSDELPHSWGQIRDIIMELLTLQNPEIMEILGAPENLKVMEKVFSPTGLVIPNQADREKQLEEISLLLRNEPSPLPSGQFMPSIMPVPDVDNHSVEAEICRYWLVSEAGRQAKTDNNAGYENVLAHMRAHQLFIQQQMMMAQPSVESESINAE
jgi:hypothetical protein